MKFYSKQLIVFLIGFTINYSLVGCNGFLDLQPPATQPSTAEVFSSDEKAETAVADLYGGEFPRSFAEASSYTAGLYADELDYTLTSTALLEFKVSSLLPDNTYITNQFWANIYKQIYNCNIIMENLQTSPGISEVAKNQYRGEALFFRALSHFTLTNAFGAIPLITVTDYRTNSTIPRTDTATVLNQVIADLEEAKSLLGEEYPHGTHIRANKWAVKALSARVYQSRQEWQKAYDASSEVIQSGLYGPLPAPESAFLDPSPESILQIGPNKTTATSNPEAVYFIPTTSTRVPSYSVRTGLLEAFEPGDLRYNAWMNNQTIDGITYYYPAKYKSRTAALPKEDVILLRLAEMYLIRAEAAVHLGNVNEAISDVDIIRSRAGLPHIADTEPNIGSNEMLEKIYQERRIELCFEHGFRWYDLKRTGKADDILSELKPTTWKSTGILYPIPESQLLANPFLEPNPGYYK
ncbi:SusD family protein [bacterium A37T11]|nr:SusD family protein [bacterium A37T11]